MDSDAFIKTVVSICDAVKGKSTVKQVNLSFDEWERLVPLQSAGSGNLKGISGIGRCPLLEDIYNFEDARCWWAMLITFLRNADVKVACLVAGERDCSHYDLSQWRRRVGADHFSVS